MSNWLWVQQFWKQSDPKWREVVPPAKISVHIELSAPGGSRGPSPPHVGLESVGALLPEHRINLALVF